MGMLGIIITMITLIVIIIIIVLIIVIILIIIIPITRNEVYACSVISMSYYNPVTHDNSGV